MREPSLTICPRAGSPLSDTPIQPSRSRDRIGFTQEKFIMPRIISPDQMRSFSERGYVVLPDVVPRPLIEAARQRVDGLIDRNPPSPQHRGFHFYWKCRLSPGDPLVDAWRGRPSNCDQPRDAARTRKAQSASGVAEHTGLESPARRSSYRRAEADGAKWTPRHIHDARRHLPDGSAERRHGKPLGLAGLAPCRECLSA